MADLKDLLLRALELPPEARVALAGSLLESLDSEVDADAEAAWSVEIGRRIREADEEEEHLSDVQQESLLRAWRQAKNGEGRQAKDVLDDLGRE